jgi:hypothetical protein
MAKIRLDNLRMARRFMVRVVNDYNEGIINATKAKTFCSIINTFSKLYEQSEIEKKVEKIEDYIHERGY